MTNMISFHDTYHNTYHVAAAAAAVVDLGALPFFCLLEESLKRHSCYGCCYCYCCYRTPFVYDKIVILQFALAIFVSPGWSGHPILGFRPPKKGGCIKTAAEKTAQTVKIFFHGFEKTVKLFHGFQNVVILLRRFFWDVCTEMAIFEQK